MRIAALSGGVGGARFLRGLVDHLATRPEPATVDVVANTGDDITLAGVRVCPDTDTLLYTLGEGVHEGQGWGRDGETHAVQAELTAYGVGPDWFTLGDRDLGTHLARSAWLGQGLTLSEVTARLADRWGLPARGVRLMPASDEPLETHVVIDDPSADGGQRAVHFQQWWVQMRAAVPARTFTVAGLDRARPAPGVLDALRQADVILLPPSNPVVSIGIILGIPGVRDVLRGSTAPVVGVAPLIGGEPVRGHLLACLEPLGVPATPAGVAGLYADLLDGWLVDAGDPVDGMPAGVRVETCDLLMRDRAGAARLAAAALDLALDLRRA